MKELVEKFEETKIIIEKFKDSNDDIIDNIIPLCYKLLEKMNIKEFIIVSNSRMVKQQKRRYNYYGSMMYFLGVNNLSNKYQLCEELKLNKDWIFIDKEDFIKENITEYLEKLINKIDLKSNSLEYKIEKKKELVEQLKIKL